MAVDKSSRDVPGTGDTTLLEHVHGLAELAFGSFTRTADLTQARHLALLPAESLELDLNDPAQRQFGDYELLELLGEGGMGVVYRARQQSLDREVAVKLLSAGPWASKEFIARFEREAQNAARMQHPAIVTIYEVGSVEGMQFFSMRLVRGESLSARLKRGERFTPREAATLMRTIAEAVGYAHSLGVLHLDLKPANVLLDEAGQPYVADFGLARRLENALAIENDEVSGTPAYMAPEQAQVRAHKLTAATDIWGLGAILYELLTGRPPFRGESVQATVKLVLEGQVRTPRRVKAGLPLDLEAIVLRCLSRNPADRYPTARALADDLAHFLEDRPVQARPLNAVQRIARWTRREPKLAATAMLAVGVLVVGLLTTTTQWRRADTNAHVAQANARTAQDNAKIATNRLWDSRDEAALRYMESADGWKAAPLLLSNLAEMEAAGDDVRAEAARKRLGIIENANPHLTDVLPAPEHASVLAISPDGHQLAATPPQLDLHLYDLTNGKQAWRRGIAGNPYGAEGMGIEHMEFDTGGRSVLATRKGSPWVPLPMGMFMYSVDARSGRWVLPPPIVDSKPLMRIGYDADGVHAITLESPTRMELWRNDPWRMIASGPKPPGVEYACAVLLAPDRRHFACRGPDPSKVWLISTATMRPIRKLDPEGFGSQMAWAFSPDSQWLALGDSDGAVVVTSVAGHEMRRLSPLPLTGIRELAFSKDGAWLAAATGKGGIYLWKWPQGGLVTQPFAADMEPSRVRLDRERLRVLASGGHGSAGIWQIPEAEFDMDRGDAVPLGDRIATLDTAAPEAAGGGDAIAWQPGHDLLAHVAEQRVQVQRLPPPVLKYARAAPIKPTTLRFDGRRLVAVEGRHVQMIDAGDEKPANAGLDFPQAPGFAELTADGRTLVVTAGRVLYAYDAANGQPRFAPVTLANSPQHVELNPDGASVVTTWLSHDAQGRAEVAEVWDLRDGRRVAGPVRLSGPQDGLLFNADGTRLLTWNFAAVSLRDGHTLAAIPGPLADLRIAPNANMEEGRVCSVAFGTNSTIWLASMRGWDHPELRHFGGGTASTSRAGDCLTRILPMPDGSLATVPKDSGAMLRLPDGTTRALPDPKPDTLSSELAASADGRWIARARRDGAVLFDARAGKRVAVLRSPLPAPDIVWQLAFSPDGNQLLARSMRNRLLVWNLQSDARPVSGIARELALRDIPSEVAGESVQAEPMDTERAALRAGDPGEPTDMPEAAPAPAVRMLPGGTVPPRDRHAPPELLDLTAHYNFAFGEVSHGSQLVAADYGWLPVGVQRFLGVDYDLRGGVQMQAEAGHVDGPRGERPLSFTVAAPRPDIAAVECLLLSNPTTTHDTRDMLEVTLRYADGGESSQAFRGFDSLQISGVPELLELAAFGYDARAYSTSRRAEHVYAVRFPNPQPGRAVRSITFTAGKGSGLAAVILAATVEPAGSAPTKR